MTIDVQILISCISYFITTVNFGFGSNVWARTLLTVQVVDIVRISSNKATCDFCLVHKHHSFGAGDPRLSSGMKMVLLHAAAIPLMVPSFLIVFLFLKDNHMCRCSSGHGGQLGANLILQKRLWSLNMINKLFYLCCRASFKLGTFINYRIHMEHF